MASMGSSRFSQAARSNRRLGIIIDNFTLSTWLCLAAGLYGTISYALPSAARALLVLPLAVLILRTSDALLIMSGLRHNRWMDGVIEGTVTAIPPDAQDDLASGGNNGNIVVFLVGARVNHPLGILAPGAKEFVDYFSSMARDLEKERQDFGMLGASSWLANKERSSDNDILLIYYFRTVAGVEKFAHSESHRKGWEWYTKWSKQYKHLALRHELYHVPAGHHENVFLNSHPTLVGATAWPLETSEKDGAGAWRSPLIAADKKALRTMWGRMGKNSQELRTRE
ncbi:hypothetical protein LTR85_002564 [Meristemomyces frigidus]|nr:hypothetical protein LTR85_002564 [Meristemomyces frigidus]